MSAARRFLVYGVTGSGKTMLARQIAHRTGLPLHEVDALTWRPGWEPVPEDEQRAIFERICRHDAWVLDHAYGAWRDVPIKHADVLVALDYPRWVSLWRLVRRTGTRVVTRRPVCGENVETWRLALSRDSIIAWHFRSFANKRRRIEAWAKDPPVPEVVRLTSPFQARLWLETLQRDRP